MCGSKTVFVYNFTTEQLEKKADMKYDRGMHALIKINKKIFVFGGRTTGGNIKESEVYSIESNTWTRIADLAVGVERGFAALHNGMVYLAGHDSKLQIYDPK